MSSYLGLDLGQATQPSALAVVERTESQGEWDPAARAHRTMVRLGLRYLERAPLGTSYPELVHSVRRVMDQLEQPCRLVVDATGVGGPVVAMLQRAGLNGEVMPVVITQGLRESRDGDYHLVPKRDLIVNLQVMLQLGELQMAASMKGMEELLKEMAEMRVRTEPGGAWREGAKDDLVLAVALACWKVKKEHPGDGAEYWGTSRRGIWEMLV